MDRRTSTSENPLAGDFAARGRIGENLRQEPPAKGGATLELGETFVRTVRHFWPDFSAWLDGVPDSRFQPFVTYDKKFLLWWGICLFVLKLGSRRQLDFDLRDLDTEVLPNLNRLSGTEQDTLPVHNTLRHFAGHIGSEPVAGIRKQMIQRLVRMRALDSSRVESYLVAAIDGTGVLRFNERHCPSCLTQTQDGQTYYFHPVLEAKLVTDFGLALSIGSEFIENPNELDAQEKQSYDDIKQDCELKAFRRLAEQLRQDFPQLRLLLTGDSLYACGTGMEICRENNFSFIFTFKPGRLPAVWEDFQALLKACPENVKHVQLPDGSSQVYRWVNDLSYQDSEGRLQQFNALLCEETVEGKTTTFAWITDRHISFNNVALLAAKGGRRKARIENEGFNMQKNSGFNLEHAYSFHPSDWKVFYYLLQIAHIMLQLVEKGSLLKRLAREYGKTPMKLFGSLKNIARRLMECFRYFRIPETAYDTVLARQFQIGLDSS